MLRTRAWIASGVLFASVVAIAGVVPQPGKEPIPELMADSILVCKGEVVTASAPDFYIVSGDLPDTTGIARVRVDRCFKGKPESSEISVQVTNHVSNVSPSFFLTTGDYGLFFLNAAGGDVYKLTNPWYGVLKVSKELGATPAGADPMYLLELDLKAGLHDADPERVLDSIRLLGAMKKLRSNPAPQQRALRRRMTFLRVRQG